MTAKPPTGRALSALWFSSDERDQARAHRAITAALKRHGTVPEAAAALGISRPTLFGWLKQRPELRDAAQLPGPGRPGA